MADGPEWQEVQKSVARDAPDGLTTNLAPAVDAEGRSLEYLVRPLLSALAEIGQFDSVYLTTIDWERRHQDVRYAHNVNGVEVPEGHRIDCPPDLSEHTFLGVTRSNELPTPHPDSHVARGLGLSTYVSVPVVTIDHRLFGTLCGASRARREVADGTVSVMESFARLIADHLTRARAARNEQRALHAEQQVRQRAMFLAEAEHQLKTPLAVIAGFVDVLVGGVALSMADTTSALDSIDRNTDLLSKQIDRLLEEAMAEFQVRDLHPALIDVGEALRASVEGSTMTGRRDLRVEAAGDVTAYLDSAVLDQIIGHLIDNAIKYSPAGAPIVLRARRAAQWLEIDVSDNGIGIPEDIDVFAAFQRGDGAAVQAKPGIGLGLHIVRNLTRAMAGEVTARRNQGGGSTFTLRFPAAT
jgi:signal transduction histidine kinase